MLRDISASVATNTRMTANLQAAREEYQHSVNDMPRRLRDRMTLITDTVLHALTGGDVGLVKLSRAMATLRAAQSAMVQTLAAKETSGKPLLQAFGLPLTPTAAMLLRNTPELHNLVMMCLPLMLKTSAFMAHVQEVHEATTIIRKASRVVAKAVEDVRSTSAKTAPRDMLLPRTQSFLVGHERAVAHRVSMLGRIDDIVAAVVHTDKLPTAWVPHAVDEPTLRIMLERDCRELAASFLDVVSSIASISDDDARDAKLKDFTATLQTTILTLLPLHILLDADLPSQCAQNGSPV